MSVCVIIHGAPLLTASQIATPVMLSSHFLLYSNWSLSEGAAEMSKALLDGKDVFWVPPLPPATIGCSSGREVQRISAVPLHCLVGGLID